MNILALDASTKSTGYAIYEGDMLSGYGCLTASGNDPIKRIKKIIPQLAHIITSNEIEVIVMEEVRPEENGKSKNRHTFKMLMYLQAAVVFLIHEINSKIKLEFMYPSEWRKDCGIKQGRGVKREVQKQQDIDFVKNNFNISVNDDEADAIGIGYSYLAKQTPAEDYNW